MYDLHTHILPGVDDGAATLEDALEMARQAVADGTRVMVATPHHKDVTEKGSAAAVHPMVERLSRLLQESGVDLRVVTGMENPLELDLPAWVEQGTALAINGTGYVLVELDFVHYPLFTSHVLSELQKQGLTPVIAHPERQAVIGRDSKVLERLVEKGVLSQITAGSLLGAFGPQVRKVAQRLLQRNVVHIIASDTHRPQGPRAPGLRPGLAEATRLVGEEAAWAMVAETPRAVVEGRPVNPPPPRPPKARSWWPLSR